MTKGGSKALLYLVLTLFAASLFFLFHSFYYQSFSSGVHEGVSLNNNSASKKGKKVKSQPDGHIKIPKAVKAVYMSQCGAKSERIRNHIKKLILDTELNAVIIDIKDYTGTISFPTQLLGGQGKGCKVNNMKELIEDFHKNNIYVIGRITVFQDPLYARAHPKLAVQSKSKNTPWSDYKGLHFIDVGARDFWRYIVKISREAHQKYGFDELNFDYIRYPSDGPMWDARYDHSDYTNRAEELEKFFRFLSYNVKVPDRKGHIPIISADLFGIVTTNYDDLTIGQVLERALPYFDFIAPMVYPSHYPKSFLGLVNPNKYVYKVVNYSMKKAVARTVSDTTPIFSFKYKKIEQKDKASNSKPLYKKPSYDKNKLRPWLQDFDYGGNYGAKEVREQIRAVYDAGLNSWMIWDPANIYTKEAFNRP